MIDKEERYKISNQKISVIKSKKYKGLFECRLNGFLVYLHFSRKSVLKQEFTKDIKSFIKELNLANGYIGLQAKRGGNISIYESRIFMCLKAGWEQ